MEDTLDALEYVAPTSERSLAEIEDFLMQDL
jgi:hypothetical protein